MAATAARGGKADSSDGGGGGGSHSRSLSSVGHREAAAIASAASDAPAAVPAYS